MSLINREDLLKKFESGALLFEPSIREIIEAEATVELVRKEREMTKVNCLLKECIYNHETICTKDEVTLYDEHPCCGGCDDGWEFADEEDENNETD